jgi:hypothetical protein
MTEPSVLFGDNVDILAVHTVEAVEIGRIDLIADRYYGNSDYSELILKYNNISNPFSIAAGDELVIPDQDNVLVKWNRVKPIDDIEVELDAIRSQFMDTKRLSTQDAKRVEYLKKKASQKKNGSKAILPPNVLKPNEKNIDINNGEIRI